VGFRASPHPWGRERNPWPNFWREALALSIGSLLPACAEPPLSPRDPTPGVFHFQVKTYNVELNESGNPATVAAVGAGEPDIVLLQEITPAWEAVLRQTYEGTYPHMMFHPVSGAGGLGVLSRFPLEDLGVRPGPADWHPAWHVLAHTPEGPLQLLNVHLRAVFWGRDSDVQAFLRVGEDHLNEIQTFSSDCEQQFPTLVAGDFNEEGTGEAIQFLESQGYRSVLGLFRPGQGTWRHPSLGGQLTKALDHILFDETLAPLDARVQRLGHSDHLPVLGHFEITDAWSALAP
jgi:endonuclease/exonuclease/phosphatase family metal-dependent hydrolase